MWLSSVQQVDVAVKWYYWEVMGFRYCSGRDGEFAGASIMPSVIVNFISFVIVYTEFSNGLYLCLAVAV